MPTAPLVVYTVPDDAPAKDEPMGTKNKFWFARDGAMWLFKATRPDSGEHWAEVVAAGLAQRLGLPHAQYQLARWRGTAGAVTHRFTPEGHDLVHGNELLAERDPDYPREGARYLRPQEHTIEAVRGVVGALGIGLPIGWQPPPGIESPVDVFGGYLLLDAWIGNTDRHHQNWALVVNPAFRAWAAQARCEPWLEQLQSVVDQETEGLVPPYPARRFPDLPGPSLRRY